MFLKNQTIIAKVDRSTPADQLCKPSRSQFLCVQCRSVLLRRVFVLQNAKKTLKMTTPTQVVSSSNNEILLHCKSNMVLVKSPCHDICSNY